MSIPDGHRAGLSKTIETARTTHNGSCPLTLCAASGWDAGHFVARATAALVSLSQLILAVSLRISFLFYVDYLKYSIAALLYRYSAFARFIMLIFA